MAPPGVDRRRLRADLRALAPKLIAAAGGTGGVVFVPEPRSPWPQVPASEPEYDAIVEFRAADERAVLGRIVAGLAALGALVHAYRAREHVAKGVSPATDGAPPHGVILAALWTRRTDVSAEDAIRHWREHEPLALVVHHGADRYVQTWFDAPLTADAPPYTGFATLRFPTLAAIATGLFRSQEDVATIDADVAEFIAATSVAYADEIR